PAEQLVVEEEADLGHDKGPRDDERPQEVVDGVGLEGEDGRLRAREDDRLTQVGHHKRQGGGAVGKGVGAVEDNEAVEEGVVLLDGAGNLLPALRGDGARVQERVELEDAVAY